MTAEQFHILALSIPGTIDAAHFDRTAYKAQGKKIFATLKRETGTANLKFSSTVQSVFCLIDKEIIFPVNNKWGLQGWTTFVLEKLDGELMLDALDAACKEATAPGKTNGK
jgi:hypothetical protein